MVGSGAPAPSITFLYGSDRNRIQQNHSINGVTTYVYAGSANLFERLVKNTTTTDTHYIYAGGQNIGVFIKKTGAANETRYFHRDHLGSIDVVTSATGTVIERMSYDAWGKRRNADWTDAASQLFPTSTPRGFTGHEMLDSLGLIHMNGRVYNPTLGRFVSADPYIQFDGNLQSFNRYSYVLNNPLSYTDPSGHFLFIPIAIASAIAMKAFEPLLAALPGPLGTILSVAVSFAIPGASFANFAQAAFGGFVAGMISTGGDFRQALIGAFTAAAFYGAGNAIGTAITSNVGQWAARSLAFGVIGGIAAEIGGGNFLSGFAAAGMATAITPIVGRAIQAVGREMRYWSRDQQMANAARYNPNTSLADLGDDLASWFARIVNPWAVGTGSTCGQCLVAATNDLEALGIKGAEYASYALAIPSDGASVLVVRGLAANSAAKATMFATRTASELKSIYGWGKGIEGVKAARGALDASAMARIQGSLSRAEVEAARDLYRTAVANGRGGQVAVERMGYMEDILSLWK